MGCLTESAEDLNIKVLGRTGKQLDLRQLEPETHLNASSAYPCLLLLFLTPYRFISYNKKHELSEQQERDRPQVLFFCFCFLLFY